MQILRQLYEIDIVGLLLTIVITAAGIIGTTAAIKGRAAARDIILYIGNGILYRVVQLATSKAAAYLSLRRYCRIQLAGTNRYLNVPGAKDVNLDIDDIFVPLVLEESGFRKHYDHRTIISAIERTVEQDVFTDVMQPPKRIVTRTIHPISSRGSVLAEPSRGPTDSPKHRTTFRTIERRVDRTRIRIIGDPGSGKSSIAKKLFRDECQKGVMSPARARLPILVELRKVAFKDPTDTPVPTADFLINYLRTEVCKHSVYEMGRCFDAYTKSTGILLILDGLDEVSSEDYPRAETLINELSRRLGSLSDQNAVIVTMRMQFHQQIRDQYHDTFPTVLQLRPFTPSDIYLFLSRWAFDEKGRSTQIIRIYNELTDRPALREMCSNPLILAMYVAHDQESDHPIAPESRTEFYSRVTDELLVRRRARGTERPEGLKALRDQRQRILGQIALRNLTDQDQPANLISWGDAIAVVADVNKFDRSRAEQYLRELSKETGLISEEKEGEFCCFIHLTFCEFLAAVETTEAGESGWVSLVEHHNRFLRETTQTNQVRLMEVLPFACGLMKRHMTHGALSDLAKAGQGRALALAFLETKAYDHPLWISFVDAGKQRFVNSAERSLEWLNDLHLYIVLCVDAERTAKINFQIPSVANISLFIRELAEMADDAIFELIEGYANQDAVAAYRVAGLCNIDILANLPRVIVRNCDQPAFFAMALDQARREAERLPLWSCALAEAGLRSSVVGRSLHESRSTLWRQKVDLIAPSRRWFLPPFVPRTPLTECITYAVQSGSISADFGRLQYFVRKPPIGGRRLEAMLGLARIPLLTFLWFIYFGILFILMFDDDGVVSNMYTISRGGHLSTFAFIVITPVALACLGIPLKRWAADVRNELDTMSPTMGALREDDLS